MVYAKSDTDSVEVEIQAGDRVEADDANGASILGTVREVYEDYCVVILDGGQTLSHCDQAMVEDWQLTKV